MATGSKKASEDIFKNYASAIELVQKGQYEKAQSALQKLKESAEDPRLSARVETYLKVCERALFKGEIDKSGPEGDYDRGVVAHNQADFEQARQSFKAALKKAEDPETAQILVALAATESKAGEITTALTHLKKALQIDFGVRFLAMGDRDFDRIRQSDAFKRLVDPPE